jgi:NB-ARC domain/Rx N-terminal domain
MVGALATAAVGWSFSTAGWLISPILSRFLIECFDALDLHLPPKFQSRKQTLFQKLEKLQTTLLPQLLILTDAAQKSDHQPRLEKWLQKLKSAFYEAENVLGILEYDRLEKKVNSQSASSSSKFNFNNLKGKLQKFSSEKKNLIKSLENLEEIINEAMEFVPLLNLPSRSSASNSTWRPNEQYRETISTPGSTVIGRDKDRDHIVKLLREDFLQSHSNAKCYSVIGIWGMGGSGKTTLAQYVCDYEKKKDPRCFDPIIWVHVSENFNVQAIMRNIWEKVYNRNCPKFENLDVLYSQVADKLRGKKYLLVLDDIWCNKDAKEEEIQNLFAPLREGQQGSKILVTTRNEEAARTLGAMDLMKLPELEHRDFLSLFMSHALGNIKVNEHLQKRLQAIGEKIVGKLCRLPIAAIIVGGQLRRKPDLDLWLSMLDKSFLNDVMGVLYLSYQHLSPPLQRCFAFCGLFPKGHIFNRDHLVNLWIAEGFIELEDANEHINNIANRYFQELISCSLFQAEKNFNDQYFMHDLIHDLAQYVSRDECFKVRSGEKKEIPTQTCHLYLADDMLEEYLENICKLKELRTIIVVSRYVTGDPLKDVHLDALFTKLRKLYIVALPHIDNLPKSVIHLKNLRYLTFQIAETAAIPEELDILYQLRTLCIWKAHSLNGNRIAIPNVGRLISLQNLEEFHVSTRRGFELKQLELLNDLFGTLIIRNLDNIKRKEEAHQAKLSEKRGIRNLHYCWDYESGDVLRDVDVEILDCLCPPPRTKQLIINGYSGKRLPCWILENNNSIPYLEHLELSYCGFLESLQGINELFDLLSLTISSLPRLKIWKPLPSNLTYLKLYSCPSLAFGLKEDLEMIKSTQIPQIVTLLESCRQEKLYDYTNVQFNYVQKMMKLSGPIDTQESSAISKDLRKCLEKRLELICQLQNVYGELYLPPLLEKLSMGSCFITDKVLAASLQGLKSLTNLKLVDIITITCVPEEVFISLTNLMVLEIRGCLLLTSFGGWDTHSTLEQLWIYNCPNLTLETSSVPNSCNPTELASSSASSSASSCSSKPSSSILNYVFLQCCSPSDDMFQNLVSVETLQVWDCPTLVNPNIGYLKSLVILDLLDCLNLTSLRGSSELNNLIKLDIRKCQKVEGHSDADKLPQLEELKICRFSQLEQLISRDGLSSLVALGLWYAQEEYYSQQECEVLGFLSSLQQIHFSVCKMSSLPNLLCVHSLRDLDITFCANLISLSELPPSVKSLLICGCNKVFTRSCQDTNSPNWHKISYIPNKRIEL